MKQNFLDKIIAWAKQETNIRALILTGSRAESGNLVLIFLHILIQRIHGKLC